MTELSSFLQNLVAFAFLVLGVIVAARWLRNRNGSTGWLALAIVLLSSVFLLPYVGRVTALPSGLTSAMSLGVFVGSGYALLRYRGSLIPLGRAWHAAALGVLLITAIASVAAPAIGLKATSPVYLAAVIGLIAAWAGCVLEPIVRFWLVARRLPAVQAWRLRSLSIGFACFVAILLLVVGLVLAGARTINPGVTLALQLVMLAVAPLLYVSFAPPSWLRREWRAGEEEGLRNYMESLLLVNDDTADLNRGGLEWAMRLSGGAAAASFDSRGITRASVGLSAEDLDELRRRVPTLPDGIHRDGLLGGAALISLPILNPEGNGRLVIVSGPFTPAFGSDELNRVQQFMTAVAAGLDRKRAVAQLRDANHQLQAASEHKNVFLANMSHELRTPLNAIIGFSELLLDAEPSQFDEATQKRFLTQVHTSGKHLLSVINDILDLSKVEAGQMELRLQMVHLATVIDQVASTVEPLAEPKHISVQTEVDGAGDVMADMGKLKQMLLNLVSNAIKFTPEHGKVTVSAKRVPAAVEIAIADTGIGISEEDQGRIFHEFFQVDPGPGRREQGTGLGLALTRRFALLHGGEVRVSSTLGHGSVFTLRLPLDTAVQVVAQAAAAAETRTDVVDLSRPLVLVVEDDASAAELITRQLEAAGFRTSVARTGLDAIAKARALRPAAITLDILLPELDGWEVITRLKRDDETSNIPVVVVSVVDNPDLGKALGAFDYFVKPVDGRLLVERLSRFKHAPSAHNGATQVLVVDDEAANRQWLSRILEPAGFSVTVAAGGQEAIELARARPPDVVLLDLMMPEVTGFDVVEALRANPSTRDTPIMILTARHLTEADKRQLNGHVSTILSRGSLGAADLVGLMNRVVGNRPTAV